MFISISSEDAEEVKNLDLDDTVTLTIVAKVTSLRKVGQPYDVQSDLAEGTVVVDLEGSLQGIELGEVTLNGSIKKAAKKLKEAEGSIRVRPDVLPG